MAGHADLEIGKSERPTGATLASPLTAAYSTEGEPNTTPPTCKAQEDRKAGKKAEDSLQDSGKIII